MSSINRLPANYDGTCSCTLNDMSIFVVARNVVMLLIAAQLPDLEAAELVLHLWYSARLTCNMIASIKKYAREPIADVVAKIQGKAENVIQAKKWAFGDTQITVRWFKQQWIGVLKILDAEHNVIKSEESRKKIVLAPSRVDYRDRELISLSGSRRACSNRFREVGVLLPFGHCLDQYENTNP